MRLDEKRLDLAADVLVATHLREETATLGRFPLEREVVELFDLTPAIPMHSTPCRRDFTSVRHAGYRAAVTSGRGGAAINAYEDQAVAAIEIH
jgi:hypothetical protein